MSALVRGNTRRDRLKKDLQKNLEEKRYIWLVYYDNYGDTCVYGVYDSENKVEEFKPECDYRIEKVQLR